MTAGSRSGHGPHQPGDHSFDGMTAFRWLKRQYASYPSSSNAKIARDLRAAKRAIEYVVTSRFEKLGGDKETLRMPNGICRYEAMYAEIQVLSAKPATDPVHTKATRILHEIHELIWKRLHELVKAHHLPNDWLPRRRTPTVSLPAAKLPESPENRTIAQPVAVAPSMPFRCTPSPRSAAMADSADRPTDGFDLQGDSSSTARRTGAAALETGSVPYPSSKQAPPIATHSEALTAAAAVLQQCANLTPDRVPLQWPQLREDLARLRTTAQAFRQTADTIEKIALRALDFMMQKIDTTARFSPSACEPVSSVTESHPVLVAVLQDGLSDSNDSRGSSVVESNWATAFHKLRFNRQAFMRHSCAHQTLAYDQALDCIDNLTAEMFARVCAQEPDATPSSPETSLSLYRYNELQRLALTAKDAGLPIQSAVEDALETIESHTALLVTTLLNQYGDVDVQSEGSISMPVTTAPSSVADASLSALDNSGVIDGGHPIAAAISLAPGLGPESGPADETPTAENWWNEQFDPRPRANSPSLSPEMTFSTDPAIEASTTWTSAFEDLVDPAMHELAPITPAQDAAQRSED